MKKKFFFCIVFTYSYVERCSKVGCISEKQRKRTFLLVFHSICITFACTNMKMKETTRRYYSSLVLLAVFLPILVLSSFHVHPEAHLDGNHCEECLHHIPHSGHFSSLSVCSFDCVLCQFLTLPFLVGALVVLTTPLFCSTFSFCLVCQHAVSDVEGCIRLRAPPFFLG